MWNINQLASFNLHGVPFYVVAPYARAHPATRLLSVNRAVLGVSHQPVLRVSIRYIWVSADSLPGLLTLIWRSVHQGDWQQNNDYV